MENHQNDLYYFAYGYNVNEKEFLKRIPNAKLVGEAILQNHVLCFSKPSMDGSGKAAIVPGVGKVYGKVYKLSKADFKTLDKLEGGYLKVLRFVWATDIKPGWNPMYVIEIEVVIYVCSNLDARLLPNINYLNTIIQGLVDSNTPEEYVDRLRKIPAISYNTNYKIKYPEF